MGKTLFVILFTLSAKHTVFFCCFFSMKALFEIASTMKLPHPANLWIIKLTNASCYFYSLS